MLFLYIADFIRKEIIILNLFKKFKLKSSSAPLYSPCLTPKSSRDSSHPFSIINSFNIANSNETNFYRTLRDSIPVIDAAISKIIHLVGGFSIHTEDPKADNLLQIFSSSVKVGPSSFGLESFVCSFLDSLLTFGNAIGEIVLNNNMDSIAGLYNADINSVVIKPGNSPIDIDIFVKNPDISISPIKFPYLICFCALNPQPSQIYGTSILKNLPFVSSILLKIYNSIGKNFDRIGNIRFSVNYKSSDDILDKSLSKQRLEKIANEWSSAMSSSDNEKVKDFITNGDIDIKVIGADNQIIDSNIPVRQMLEQIVAKLGIPPFLLGLSWSTSERMSTQQADILTSELNYYRRLLSPIILKIAKTFLYLNGFYYEPFIKWSNINLQDEIEFAKARLYNAQASKIENSLLSK